jgi:hypothetical protein
MKLHKINKEQRLYVMPCGGGFSCYGFDVLDRKGRELTAELAKITGNLPRDLAEEARVLVVPWNEGKGTKKAFNHYSALHDFARRINAATRYRFSFELSPQLVGLEGKRVEVVTLYGETRRFIVGKSTGFIPCHLEIARRDPTGGGAAEKEYKSVRVVG